MINVEMNFLKGRIYIFRMFRLVITKSTSTKHIERTIIRKQTENIGTLPRVSSHLSKINLGLLTWVASCRNRSVSSGVASRRAATFTWATSP